MAVGFCHDVEDAVVEGFNPDQDFLAISSDTFTYEDIEARIDDEGLDLLEAEIQRRREERKS